MISINGACSFINQFVHSLVHSLFIHPFINSLPIINKAFKQRRVVVDVVHLHGQSAGGAFARRSEIARGNAEEMPRHHLSIQLLVNLAGKKEDELNKN